MKKEISENANITANSKQIDVLKEHFPNCFDKDGAFQPHKLEELVKASGSDITREGYTLNWLGKSYARLLANENVRTLLAANEEHNSKPENANSENLLIQGDNLEVLKHLKNAYREKVKMIYIDPPYNTGSDGFVYADDRKFTVEQLSQLAGIEDDEAKRILEFTQSKSNSHSAWLTFMFPRLYIARELLREDGVIFISIDDNEQAQLKLLCDEVFGEENFVGHLMWKRRVSSALDESNLSTDHEGVICYKKSEFEGFRGIAKNFKNYKNPDNDPRGDWISDNLTVGMSAAMRPNQAYDLLDPETGISYPHNPNRVWAFIPETMDRMILEGRILFPSDNSKRPMQKRFKGELKTQFNPYSTLMMNHVGLNSEATKAMQSLLTCNIFE
ncbi:MAG: site-specific DNA-methyltransferase, partial [Hyphomicrobiales bacterium]